MARKAVTRKTGQIYVANDSFVADVNGLPTSFRANVSRAYEGDEVLEKYPHLFDILEDHDYHADQ